MPYPRLRPLPPSGSVLVAITAVAIPLPAHAATPPAPIVESVAVLEELPLPAAGTAAPGGFRLGGLSDLLVLPTVDGVAIWSITDRGPNGAILDPPVEGQPPKSRRTLPLPDFSPLLVRLESGPGRTTLAARETLPLSTAGNAPTSGRPTSAPANAKPIVDPRTREPVRLDPDGFDPEGLSRDGQGHFWIAEEYVPSLAEVDADGRVLRRFVPEGVTLPGASCEVLDTLPAGYVRRRDNRGFESLAIAPDGKTLFAMLQSPPEEDPVEGVAPSLVVPLLEFDPQTGRTRAEHAYRLGDPDGEACDWCLAAADGKISAIAAAGPRALLVLEQSDTDSRLYRIDVPEASEGTAPPLAKTLVADLGPLAARFHGDIVPGAEAAPPRASELKFEGLAVLGPGRVALVNDNDFDIAPDGAGPSDPAVRRTCLWILSLPTPGF